LLGLRGKVRWLSAGVILALVVSVVWPVVLIVVSQRTPWARDIIRSLRWSDTPAKSGSDRPDQPEIQPSEHQPAPKHEVPDRPLPSKKAPDRAMIDTSQGGSSSSTMPATKGPLPNE
jgi:hypothetical protein